MYDLIILGGGPAGYCAAERAGAAGLSTVLIENEYLGGVCLNQGCIPSKTILASSKLYSQALHSQAFGVNAENVTLDLATVMQRKDKIINALRKGIAATLEKNHVVVETGNGIILPKPGADFVCEVNGKTITGKRLLVCTGSEAVRLPVPGADLPHVYTNREILSVNTLPKQLVVIGGGVIGLELATFFAEAGCKVTVIEMLPSIGGKLDPEISRILLKELEKKGITFHLQAKVMAIDNKEVAFENNGETGKIAADIVLMSVGRRPVTNGLGLENLNVYTEKGAIKTDAQGRTNIPGVWAAGDVNGVSMLAHTAYREAEVCVNNMLDIKDQMRYNAVPSVIYTHPEVATVGLTLDDAIKAGYDAACSSLPLAYSGRFLAENDNTRGICKVVTDNKLKTILGVHIIGGPCSEMIFGAAIMIESELRVNDIKEIVFPHPSVSEIIKDVLWHN